MGDEIGLLQKERATLACKACDSSSSFVCVVAVFELNLVKVEQIGVGGLFACSSHAQLDGSILDNIQLFLSLLLLLQPTMRRPNETIGHSI